jgi:hypothetical protein
MNTINDRDISFEEIKGEAKVIPAKESAIVIEDLD